MKTKIANLYDAAAKAHAAAKSLIDQYDGKEIPADVNAQIDAHLDECEEKTNEAKRLERLDARERELGEPLNARLGAGNGGNEKGAGNPDELAAYRRALRHGVKSLNASEIKSLRADSDDAGGFLVMPQQIASNLLKFVDDEVYIRQLATVTQLTQADSLGIPTMDNDINDADWTSELATGSEQSGDDLFGKRELKPHPLAKRIKVSNKLIRLSMLPIEQIIQQRLGYKFGVTMEKGYVVGDGVQKPLGLFVASDSGIPTSRDVTSTASGDVKADDLFDMKYGLKSQYQNSPNTRWFFHRDFTKKVRKLKDGNGQFLWQPGLGGQPGTLLDTPFVQSEYAPNTFTTGSYVAVLGDMRFYHIVDSLQVQIQTLLELYAETNQRGYIARYEGDGAPVLAEAFVRLKTL